LPIFWPQGIQQGFFFVAHYGMRRNDVLAIAGIRDWMRIQGVMCVQNDTQKPYDEYQNYQRNKSDRIRHNNDYNCEIKHLRPELDIITRIIIISIDGLQKLRRYKLNNDE
jgi:hypothetical protein